MLEQFFFMENIALVCFLFLDFVCTELEKELYMAQDAVFELKRRSAQLEDDNLHLEKALQNAQMSLSGSSQINTSKQAELEK